MKKQTKIALIIGAVAIGGFLLWKSSQPKKSMSGKKKADGGCGCAGKVELPEFGRPVVLEN